MRSPQVSKAPWNRKQRGSWLMASPWQVPKVLVAQKVVGGQQRSSTPCSCPPQPLPTLVTHIFLLFEKKKQTSHHQLQPNTQVPS